MSQLLKLYLFANNSLQTFGWYKTKLSLLSPFIPFYLFKSVHHFLLFLVRTISLFRILTSFIATNSFNGAYASAGDLSVSFFVLKFNYPRLFPGKMKENELKFSIIVGNMQDLSYFLFLLFLTDLEIH